MIELTPDTIKSTVHESKLPVVVFLTAKHCSPCRALYPLLESLVAEYEGRLAIVKADCEVVDEWSQELKIVSIPRLVIFKDGSELKRIDVRNKGDMHLEFDAICSPAQNPNPAQPTADAAALVISQETYQSAVTAAKAAHESEQQAIGAWWTSIVGEAAAAYDKAWEPLNQATTEALANDQIYLAKDEDERRWAWIHKRHELQAEARFAETRAHIEVADAAFDKVAQPYSEERGRRYDQAQASYEAAIQAARQAYRDKTGNWPAGN